MSTETFTSRDGARITYDVQGSGPALVLLHGLSQYRELWGKYGWVELLSQHHTVLTPDARGAGDSTSDATPTAHAIDRYLEDFEGLLDHAGAADAAVWGWSFGGGVALQLAAHSSRVTGAIVSGASFGRSFTPEVVKQRLENLDKLETARRTGDWDGISSQQRETAERTDFYATRARLAATPYWPVIEPRSLRRPALILTGTEDSAFARLQANAGEIAAAGIGLHIFDGLNHVQLVSERETIAPVVTLFLAEHAHPLAVR